MNDATEYRDRESQPHKEVRQPHDVPVAVPAEIPVESFIDVRASFDGYIESANGLRVRGSISGEIVCRGTLTIEEHAISKARVDAQDCDVYGTLEGDVACAGQLRLAPTAVVTATVRARALIVEEGASITGSVETTSELSQWPRPRTVVPSDGTAPPPPSRSEGSEDRQTISPDATEVLHAYCMHCQVKQPIADAHQVTMQNGRPAIEGSCTSCGTRIFRILGGKGTPG